MDIQQQNQQIQFPISFKLKIISIIYDNEQSAYTRFGKVLDDHAIVHSGWDCLPSSGGRYASYRVDVTLNDEKTFRSMYSDLGALDGIKCII